MSDTEFRRIFNNLTELQALNEDLLQDFEYRVEHWAESQKIADVIVKKGPFLKLYNNYIREFSSNNENFKDCLNRLPKFKKLVTDFESRDRCKSLKMQHYMLKPVQRLPQYRLLLEDYLKHLDPDGDDFDDTTTALRIVSEVAEQADNTIKQGVSSAIYQNLTMLVLLDFELI
jgi:FYVE/RhoGEF/PH domain-containing protein 5/6